jgi:hypothetical protein
VAEAPGRRAAGARPASAGVPLRLALRRLRLHAGRSALAAAGVAAGTAVLALTLAVSTAVQDRAVQRALVGLGASDRAVQVTWSGVPGQSELSLARLDRLARRALRTVAAEPPVRVAVFRQANWGGAYVSLAAVDGAARWLALRSGRLPRPCTPRRCELLQLGAGPRARPRLPSLHVVGRAALRPGAPFAEYLAAQGGRHAPVLVANGVAGFLHVPLPDVGLVARTYGWVVPLAPRTVHAWEIPALRRRLDLAQNRVEAATDLFGFAAPVDTLSAVEATGRVAARRLLVVGGDAAVLLLAFALLASTRLRRDHRALHGRLRRLGARPWQGMLAAGVEILALAVVGVIAGWAVGLGAGALLAHGLGAPGWAAVEHSALAPCGLVLAAGLVGLATLVMLAALQSRGFGVGALTVTPADVAAIGAIGAIVLAFARGKADAASLAASGGTGALLLVLPVLVLLVLAVAAARLLSPALRLLERAARRGPVSARVALLSLARAPGQVTLTVAFFLVAVGVAVFALAYRGTLLAGERQQARYAVPAAFVLREDLQRLVPLQQAAAPAALARVGRVTPVLRDAGFVTGNGGRDFTLLALPAAALGRIQGWRSDFSARTPAALARLVRPPGRVTPAGLRLPAAARSLALPVEIRGDEVGLTLTVLDRRGDFSAIRLGEHGAGRHLLRARVPPAARGGTVTALWLAFPVIAAFVAGHRESGTSLSVSDASTGVLRLGRLRAGATVLGDWPGWIGVDGIRRLSQGGPRLRYLVNRAADSVFRPRGPLEGEAVPVVASPAVAAAAGADGLVPLHVEESTILARVVGVARYVPSVSGDAVVADLSWWLAAANAASPGSAVPTELWIDRPRPAAARVLDRPPLAALDVSSQRAEAASLSGDPLAAGTLDVLLVAAVAALALAVVGVGLTVVGDVRDESGELFDLEAQGASPREVRRHLLVRAGTVTALGTIAGLAAGLAVGALVVRVVTVTAGAGTPLPPLVRVADWPLVAAALGALCILSLLVALAAAWGAFDAVGRRRFSEGLE